MTTPAPSADNADRRRQETARAAVRGRRPTPASRSGRSWAGIAAGAAELALAFAFALASSWCASTALSLWDDGGVARDYLAWSRLTAATAGTAATAAVQHGVPGSAAALAGSVPMAALAGLLAYGAVEGAIAGWRRAAGALNGRP